MFGYIKINKPQLRICEYDAYKSLYCGLCKQLDQKYGFWARFTLNYDFTFLALLAIATTKNTPVIDKAHCPFNPLKKINSCHNNKEIEFSADVAMLMLYYKLIDTANDETFFKRTLAKLGILCLKHSYKKAKNSQPQIDILMRDYMDTQQKLEQEKCTSTDEISHPTADMLGNIFANLTQNTIEKPALYRMGYFMGKYIYLCDAIDDVEEDLKKNNYNVLNLQNAENITDKYAIAKNSVYLSIAEAQNAFNLLTIHHFEPIIENILFLGLKDNVDYIFMNKNNKKTKCKRTERLEINND